MVKFEFSLQSLYNIKLQMEEMAKNKLSKVLRDLKYQEDQLAKYKNEKSDYINELSKRCANGISSYALKLYNLYISQLNGKITRQKENVKFAQKNVDKVREELIRVTQEKEMLEKLRERKYMEFIYERNKLEQRLVDEIISYKESQKAISAISI